MEGVMIMDSKSCGDTCEKIMKDLQCSSESNAQELSSEIAHNLNESNESLVMEVVVNLGGEKAAELYYKVKSIEQSGGLLTTDGLRRRTPGGVFFYLVNTDSSIDNDVKKQIFQDTSKAKYKMKTQATKEKRKKKNEELKELLVKEGLLSVQNH